MFKSDVAKKYALKVLALTFATDKEQIIEDLNKDGVVFLEVHKDKIFTTLDAPRERRDARITLEKRDKKKVSIDILTPATQKILKKLKDEGIIDNTWEIESGRSYHVKPEKTEFDFFLNPKNTLTQAFNGKLTMYHGTSSEDYDKIKTKGLVPLYHGSNVQPGFESRFKHEKNTKVLYLTSDISAAEQYAITRCDSLGREYKKKGASVIPGLSSFEGFHVKMDDGKYKNIYPVVLSVTIPDIKNLVADDDYINDFARKIADEIWEKKPEEEKTRIIDKLKKERTDLTPDWKGWRDPTHQVMLWRETEEGFSEILSKMPKSRYSEWLKSLVEKSQLGYRGVIPPKFIQILKNSRA